MAPSNELDLRILASHQGRLRAFVTALLRDEHAAADVLQETWLRAAGRAPRDPQALGGWLRAIARRIALNERRGARRRTRRERETARGEALPSSAEVAARVEMQRLVIDVLERLGEPHRRLLRDRYFGDLTARELARRDGSSLHTVKDRLRRARAAMRAALEREGLTEDGDLRGALLACPAWPAWPASIGGSILMKKLIAVACVALAAAVLWQSVTRDPDLVPQSVLAVPAASAELASPPAEDVAQVTPAGIDGERRAADSPEASADVPSAPWVLRGRVREESGAGGAVPRVRMRVTMYAGYELGGDVLAARSVESDASGRFEWTLADPRRTVTIAIDPAPDPSLSIQTPVPVLAVVGEGAPNELVVRVSRRDAWIEGRVRAAAGGPPIEGARVVYNDAEVLTGPLGEYLLRVASKGFGSVIVHARGYRVGGRTPGGLAAGETTLVDVELERELGPEARVFGFVRGADGTFVPGAIVRCAGAYAEARADLGGRYELHGIELSADASVVIEASAPGYANQTEYLDQGPDGPPTEAGTRLDIVLSRGTRIEGTVSDARGRAVRGAELWLGPIAMLANNRKTHSGDDGRFRFDAVPPGPTKLGVSKRGLVERSLDLDVPAAGTPAVALELVLADAVTLRGRVVDERGEAVAEALIRARPVVQPGELSSFRGRTAATDAEGRFALAGVPEQELELTVTRDGIVRRSLVVPYDAREQLLVVTRAGRLLGRVIDAATRRPIERFTVRLLPPDDESLGPWFSGIEASWIYGGRAFSAVDGAWATDETDPLRVGAWTAVEVEAEGYHPWRIDAVQVPQPGGGAEIESALAAVPRER